jgi:ABC-type Fe3+/spermidine/putrescine transport system ATPase subunit
VLFAAPTEIYDIPRSLFVNTFVGTSNVLNGLMSVTGSQPVVFARAPRAIFHVIWLGLKASILWTKPSCLMLPRH